MFCRARPSRSRGSFTSRRRRAASRRSRAASSISRRWRSRRSACCRRRRRGSSSRCRAIDLARRRWPISRPPIMDIKPEEKQEILETIDLTARMDKVSRLLAQRIEVLRISHEIGRQTKAAFDERQREAVLREQMAAIQRQLGEGDGKAEEVAELSEAIAEGRHARGGRGAGPQGAAPLRAHAGGRRRGRHGPDLSRLADRAAVEAARGEADRHRARRGAILDEDHFGLEKIKTAHRRVPGGPQARPGGQGADPLLRRPARRRQDLARPVDRPRDGPAVRAGEPRRRARRGRDPRPPAHLYRRAARQHHPGDPQGRRAQLRDDARRDRQDRPRHPGRPVLGDARGARPRAEPHLPRQLPRRAVRPLAGGLHRDGQHARHHPGAAARPHGGDQPRRLHRGREARDRPALPRPPPARGERPDAPSRPRSATRRCARSSATTRARPACATSSARSAASLRHAAVRIAEGSAEHVRIDAGRSRRHPRRAALRERGGDAHQRAGRRHRPRLDAGRRRHPVHRGEPHARQGRPDPDRPARRRDARERAGGADPGEEPRRLARHRPGALREERHPRPRSRRRDPEGRPERRRRHVHRAPVAADGPDGAQRHRDDRRDLACAASSCRWAGSRRRWSRPPPRG